jgi:hypothetical protein
MKVQDLKVNEIYTYTVDKKIPLKFKRYHGVYNGFGDNYFIAHFEPVETHENKNWLSSTPEDITINFDKDNGNDFVKLKNRTFECRNCNGVFLFTEQIKEHNYINAIGFYCDKCKCEYDQELFDDWQRDC